jgi:hypothetical protein
LVFLWLYTSPTSLKGKKNNRTYSSSSENRARRRKTTPYSHYRFRMVYCLIELTFAGGCFQHNIRILYGWVCVCPGSWDGRDPPWHAISDGNGACVSTNYCTISCCVAFLLVQSCSRVSSISDIIQVLTSDCFSFFFNWEEGNSKQSFDSFYIIINIYLFIFKILQLATVTDSPADVTLIRHYSTRPVTAVIALIARPIAMGPTANAVVNSFTSAKIITVFPAIVKRQVNQSFDYTSLAHLNPIKNTTSTRSLITKNPR